jgi:hypothetical protein
MEKNVQSSKKYELKPAAPLPVLKCRSYAGFWHFYPEMSSKKGVFWPKSGSAAAGSKMRFFYMLCPQGWSREKLCTAH